MKIGIFGGTFDPPHLGHMILATEARYQLQLGSLLWVLTNVPPHKRYKYITPIEDRLAMLQAIIALDPGFAISRVDIDRPGPHYSVDTLRLIKDKFPNDEIFFLLGGDALNDLPMWKDPANLIEYCDGIGVMRRPGTEVDLENLEKQLPGITHKIRIVETPLIEISSHDIQQRILSQQPYRFFLHDCVYEIIKERKLYLENKDSVI